MKKKKTVIKFKSDFLYFFFSGMKFYGICAFVIAGVLGLGIILLSALHILPKGIDMQNKTVLTALSCVGAAFFLVCWVRRMWSNMRKIVIDTQNKALRYYIRGKLIKQYDLGKCFAGYKLNYSTTTHTPSNVTEEDFGGAASVRNLIIRELPLLEAYEIDCTFLRLERYDELLKICGDMSGVDEKGRLKA